MHEASHSLFVWVGSLHDQLLSAAGLDRKTECFNSWCSRRSGSIARFGVAAAEDRYVDTPATFFIAISATLKLP